MMSALQKHSEPPPRLLVTPDETARLLNISRSKLYELWASENPNAAPPFIEIGKQRKVALDSIRKWIAKNERK